MDVTEGRDDPGPIATAVIVAVVVAALLLSGACLVAAVTGSLHLYHGEEWLF
jgi:hypothetical protein